MRGKAVYDGGSGGGAFEGEPMDAYGIPLSVRHAPQTALGVWQYVHQLETPIDDPRRAGSPYTHVCLLCAEELQREHAIVSPSAWTRALMRQRMSTNAVKHLERRHPNVSCETRRRGGAKRASLGGVNDADMAAGLSAGPTSIMTPSASPAAAVVTALPAKRARKMTKKQLQVMMKDTGDVDAASMDQGAMHDRSPAPFQAPMPSASITPPRPAGRQTQSAASRSSPEQILFLLHRWLISAGLAHAETRNEELQRLLTVALKTPGLELSAPAAFDTHLEMEFAQFAQGVEQYLSRERFAACDRPFVSLQCDVRAVHGSVDVLGLSVALVDSKWRHVVLPLVAQPLPITTPNSGNSMAELTHKAIHDALSDAYKIDVDALQKFSSVKSDDAPAFTKTRQEDDLIHAVSASLLHALGIVGAFEYDSELYSIRWLENSLEKLLAFFQDPARRGKLYQIGEFYHAQPAALGEINANTRLGYLYELFKRSCLNYATYSRYFATTPTLNTTSSSTAGVGAGNDGERIWAQLAACDAWQTIAEIEAVLNQLTSQLELDMLHPRRVSSSYAHFFRRLLKVTLNAKSLKCLSLEELSSAPYGNRDAESARRESHPAEQLTATTRGFMTRLRSEIDVRFCPSPSTNEIKAMLLDPRIKSKVASLVDDHDEVAKAENELRSEHRAVFMALAEREFASAGSDDKRSQPKPESSATGNVGGNANADDDSDEDEMSALLAMDGPSKRTSAAQNSLGFASAGNSNASNDDGEVDASAAAAEAMALRTAELEQAEQQAWQQWQSLAVEWEHFASSGDIFLKNGQYNVAKLYQRVDVLLWFRASGAQLHPSVAVLARAYLTRPAVASAAHDEFVASLGNWDVVGLHKPADVRREARLRVLQRNWRQWKELAAGEGFSGRRGNNKRVTVV